MKSRRDFLKKSAVFIGMIGAAGITGGLPQNVLAYDPSDSRQPPAPPPGKAKVLVLNRENLGKLSHNLFSSASERQKFLSNPEAYAEKLLGGKLDAAAKKKVQTFQEMIADGYCCQGCGCGVPVRDVRIP